MKTVESGGLRYAALAAVAGAVLLLGCATAEQNMAEQQKLHLIPGKQIYTTGPNYLAWVTQDEFNNTYQGCGYDAACNYVP